MLVVKSSPKTLHTTGSAAAELGVTACRVRALIAAGRIQATRTGRDWLIKPEALAAVRERKPGRPPNIPGRKR
jgi:excisionase family DNA binding protein